MAKINDPLAAALLDTYGRRFPAGSRLELRKADGVLAAIQLTGDPWTVDGRAIDVLGGWSGVASGDGLVDNYLLTSPDGLYEDAGTVSGPNGEGDMRMDNPTLARGQGVFVNSFRKEL